MNGKMILITGAAGGIGRALTQRAAEAGAYVAALDVRDEVRDLSGPQVLALRVDATDEAQVGAAMREVRERCGRLDVLVNNAGRVGSGRVEDVALEDWNAILATNLTSAFLCAKHAIPLLRETRGAMVNMSSTNGLTGGSHLSGPAYAVAKAGIIALTKNLARDLAADGVRVNCVAPGPVDTPMLDRLGDAGREQLRAGIPLGELATTDDVVNAVFFLASDAARHITGVTLSLSGGLVMR
jgi:3-oxoacyl-[acyl-carrier protein] reductase